MISFTGAVIGYITNYISNFIENANGGKRKVYLSHHTVIINWNSRASEIVNDMLYNKQHQKVVILVPSGKEQIERELNERIAATIAKENEQLKKEIAESACSRKGHLYRKGRLKNNLTILVREGDVFSTQQLTDISVQRAKTIIILGNDTNNAVCKYEKLTQNAAIDAGNQLTVKTLIQVAELTGAENSFNNQKIVVETDDVWTSDTVNMVVKSKHVAGKNNIVPVSVNEILGILLAQFSLMPELNLAYVELLSNKGVTFYAEKTQYEKEEDYVKDCLMHSKHMIPLTTMKDGDTLYGYYAAEKENDAFEYDAKATYSTDLEVKINKSFWFDQKNIIILGHNSKLQHIMDGFDSFRNEWSLPNKKDIINIIAIDDKAHLEKMNYYNDYPYVKKVVEANIFDREKICSTIEKFVDANKNDTSILVLSDDSVPSDEIDADVITNLIYIRDIIMRKKEADPEFDENSIDVVVEIINPKHYDVIKNYNIKNIVISNRYISKIIGQLGEKDVLYNFYNDILRYDDDNSSFQSKELYIKEARKFFRSIPPKCKVYDLVRAVYNAMYDESMPPEERNHTILLGYVKPTGEIHLFGGDQQNTEVELSKNDKLIVFTNH